jgi:hypothetical protein
MRSSFKSTFVLTTAIAIALTSLDLRPAAATPESGPAIVKQNGGEFEFGAARKRRRYRGNPAIPLAAFGAIIGTIGGIAAAQQRRDYYERQYDGPYYGGHVYHQPYAAPAPVYRQYHHAPQRSFAGRPYDYVPRDHSGAPLNNSPGPDRTAP